MLETNRNQTIFDQEIADLEQKRQHIENERLQLLAGNLITQDQQGHVVEVNLGQLSGPNSKSGAQHDLKEMLRSENPIVAEIAHNFERMQDLQEEMVLRGILPLASTTSSHPLAGSLLVKNYRFNRALSGKTKLVGAFVSSPWLIAAGLALLLLWIAGPLIYSLTGGAFAGAKPANNQPVPSPFTATALPKSLAATPSATVYPTTGRVNTSQAERNILVSFGGSAEIRDQDNPKTTFIDFPVVQTLATEPPLRSSISPLPATVTPASKSLTATPAATAGETSDQEGGNRVGQPPSSAGGLNGPHGAFLAPSKLNIPALGLKADISRAIVGEGEGEAVKIVWPTQGETVAHFGAYPGETGNMILLANQESLGTIRQIQLNDEIIFFDRKNNKFVYRFISLSETGQVERVVDPTADTWLFAQPSNQALVTILIFYPQFQFPSGSTASQEGNVKAGKDDLLNPKKLAYRAVLVQYAPVEQTPVGTPVVVPQEVWATKGSLTNATPTPVPSATPVVPVVSGSTSPAVEIIPLPSSTPAVPQLPKTGEGG